MIVQGEITWLGHELDENGSSSITKIPAILDFQLPPSVQQLKPSLGSIQNYAKTFTSLLNKSERT